AGEDEGDGGERVAGERRPHRRATVVDLLLDEAVVEAGEAEAAVLLGDLEVDEAELPGLLEDLLGELAALVEVLGNRNDLVARELARGLDEGLLLVGVTHVEHRVSFAAEGFSSRWRHDCKAARRRGISRSAEVSCSRN